MRKAKRRPPLLAGGNPQITKADGDSPVQSYIAALPGWKRDTGRRLDALIVKNVPHVRKAVKWNSPFYGVDGAGWFLGVHAFTNYIKVTFFKGTSLRPVPPGGTSKEARWIDVRENDLDERQMAAWVKQAAEGPGWVTSDILQTMAGASMKKTAESGGPPASELISEKIAGLGDWRGKTLARMRKLIKEADPGVVEEWKWMGTPVWSHDGIICTGETYKKVVKLTFAKGASLKDPARLFNSSLDGNTRRAIDIAEGEEVDATAFKALIRQAVAFNGSGKSNSPKNAKP